MELGRSIARWEERTQKKRLLLVCFEIRIDGTDLEFLAAVPWSLDWHLASGLQQKRVGIEVVRLSAARLLAEKGADVYCTADKPILLE